MCVVLLTITYGVWQMPSWWWYYLGLARLPGWCAGLTERQVPSNHLDRSVCSVPLSNLAVMGIAEHVVAGPSVLPV